MSDEFCEALDKNAKTMMQICEQASKICEPCKLRETVRCDKADCIVNMRRFVGMNFAVAEHERKLDGLKQKLSELLKQFEDYPIFHSSLQELEKLLKEEVES